MKLSNWKRRRNWRLKARRSHLMFTSSSKQLEMPVEPSVWFMQWQTTRHSWTLVSSRKQIVNYHKFGIPCGRMYLRSCCSCFSCYLIVLDSRWTFLILTYLIPPDSDSSLKKFLEHTSKMTPEERANFLEKDEVKKHTHSLCSRSGFWEKHLLKVYFVNTRNKSLFKWLFFLHEIWELMNSSGFIFKPSVSREN